MALSIQSYLETLSILFCFAFLLYHYYNLFLKRCKNSSILPTTWPVIGMLPAILQNCHRLHEYGTQVLKESGGTFRYRGPWLANIDFVVTCDPATVHHILSKNFANYPKGPEFKKMFEFFGDGIFNADAELWEAHRKITLSVMHNPKFQRLMETTVWTKIQEGLLPVLENCAKTGSQIDLQDIFQRFTFDTFSKLLLDHDPASLSVDLPNLPWGKGFNDAAKAIFHRHILPKKIWELQKWLGIGKEKKLSKACDDFEHYIFPCIELKQGKLKSKSIMEETAAFDGLTAFLEAYNNYKGPNIENCNEKVFMRDVMLNLLFAGRDAMSAALSWFFWLLSKNPEVEDKIRDELATKLGIKQETVEDENREETPKKGEIKNPRLCINVQDTHKLVYLHGALCEALRLYPSLALELKTPVKADILPSGLRVDANTKLFLSYYSMGRMESIWGDDCLEFKPERWISEHGKVRHEPSYKFPAFHAGPRTCIGKEMSMVQMKMMAASMIHSHHIQVLDGHPVSPSDSIIIQMKQGLMVRPFKRN